MKPTITFHDIASIELEPVKTFTRDSREVSSMHPFSMRRLTMRDENADTFTIEFYAKDDVSLRIEGDVSESVTK